MAREYRPLPIQTEMTMETLDRAYNECVRRVPQVYRALKRLALGHGPRPAPAAVQEGAPPKSADQLKAIQLYLELFDPRISQERMTNTAAAAEGDGERPALTTQKARDAWRLLQGLGFDISAVIQGAPKNGREMVYAGNTPPAARLPDLPKDG